MSLLERIWLWLTSRRYRSLTRLERAYLSHQVYGDRQQAERDRKATP